MSKIVQAVNAMVSNPKKFTKIVASSGIEVEELFFLYDTKYKWSIMRDTGGKEFYLHYYPGSETVEEMAAYGDDWPDTIDSITYTSKSLKSREAQESFEALFKLAKDKCWGMDEVLNDILADDIAMDDDGPSE